MKRSVHILTRPISAVVAAIALLCAGSAPAQTLFWDGGTSDILTGGDGVSDGAAGIWNNSLLNWDNGANHVAWSSGADAVFAMTNIVSGAGLVTLAEPITVNSLAVLTTNYVFGDNGSSNTLTVGTVTNSANTTISNDVVNSTGFVKDGSGTLIVLGASPNLTAPVSVNGGTLRFGGTGASGTYGPQAFGDVTVASNATLQLFPYESATYSQNISGNGSVMVQSTSSGRNINVLGNSTFSGNFTVNAATAVIISLSDTTPNGLGYSTNVTIGTGASATTLKYAGSGETTTRSLTLAGTTGTTSLIVDTYGPLTWRGPALVGSTTPRTLTLGGTSTQPNEFAGTIANGITNMALLKRDTGTWWVTGSNTYSGGTTINAGTLIITNDSALGVSTGRVTFINGQSSTLMGTLKSASNDVTLAASRTFVMGFTNAGGGFGVADASNLIVESYLTGTGSVQRAQGGTGVVRFSNDTNDYTGDFSVQSGIVEFTSVANQGTASSLGKGKAATGGLIKLSTVNTFSTLRYTGTNNSATTRPLDWMNNQSLNLESSGAGTVAWLAAGPLKSGNSSGTLTLRGSNTGANTLNQIINDNGGVTSLNKSGDGQWVLTANNTFSGPVTITGGKLTVSQDANLGTVPGVATPNTVNFNGGTLCASASFTLSANRGLAIGPLDTNVSGIGTIEVAASQTLTYAGIIADRTSTNSGSLIKTGAGTLTLSGVNTYTGDTTVSAGTLALTGTGTLGTGTNISLASGATLDVTSTAGLTLGAIQALHASGATATLAGNVNASSAALMIDYTNGTPTLNVTGGALTLAAGTVTTVNVQNGGILLPGGDYKLVSVSSGGSVAGIAPTALTVTGDVTNTATLAINGGELYLHVPSSALTPPTLSGVAKSGSDVVVSFNGPSGQTYQVLTSTNVALPLPSWTSVASGTFTGSPVTYTNTANEPKRFYIITSP